jgi:predicted alpha/beta hydrolase family esterase
MTISRAASLTLIAGDLPHADRHSVPLNFDSGGKIGRWAAQIDTALIGLNEPVIVVAEELAAVAFAHWALLSPHSYSRQIAGAVFLSPSEPREWAQAGLTSTPATPLPFPSLLVGSGTPTTAHELDLAARWRSRFVTHDITQAQAAGDAIEASLLAALRFYLAPRQTQPLAALIRPASVTKTPLAASAQ